MFSAKHGSMFFVPHFVTVSCSFLVYWACVNEAGRRYCTCMVCSVMSGFSVLLKRCPGGHFRSYIQQLINAETQKARFPVLCKVLHQPMLHIHSCIGVVLHLVPYVAARNGFIRLPSVESNVRGGIQNIPDWYHHL
jgi:hypothetical protein